MIASVMTFWRSAREIELMPWACLKSARAFSAALQGGERLVALAAHVVLGGLAGAGAALVDVARGRRR
jgi:hypothetical protein